MHVYLVRHGETFLGKRGVHQSPNTPLSPKGKEQAESIAESLREFNPSLILTSGYTRAVETARVIGLRTGNTPKVSSLFSEIVRPSSLYHTRLVSLATLRYVIFSFLKRKNPTWHYKDAENYTDLCNRARDARNYLESLAKKQKTVVVVSHTVFMHVLLAVLCQDKMPSTLAMVRIFLGFARFPHTGVIHLEYAPTAPKSKTCAWITHEDTAKIPQPRSRPLFPNARLVFMRLVRVTAYTAVVAFLLAVCGVSIVTEHAHTDALTMSQTSPISPKTEEPFPVGVDVARQEITELPHVEEFFTEHTDQKEHKKTAWIQKALGKLALSGLYQNLASLSERILVIQPGERKEQIASHFGKILGWSAEDQKRFLELVTTTNPVVAEGKFFPGTYSVKRGATPEEVAWIILDTFNKKVFDHYSDDVAAKVPLRDALTIASLLEREAYSFDDMREISGVIWNRLFAGMKLQIDATLQYAKGTNSAKTWWPTPVPKDKYINSSYNTYLHEGLPPAPIANPSVAAILAALNPIKTDCMYYFHDKDSAFHCAATYEEHVALLKTYYGRGK